MNFLTKIEKQFEVQAGDNWTQVEYKVRVRQEGDDKAADAALLKSFEKDLAALMEKYNKGKEIGPLSSFPVILKK